MISEVTRNATIHDGSDVASSLKTLIDSDPATCFELRAFVDGKPLYIRRYSPDQVCKAAEDALAWDREEGADAVYVTINPADASKMEGKSSGDAVRDSEILRRRWLFIDADPEKAGGAGSATEDEKAEARQLLDEVLGRLSSAGWPAPIVADSGNGWHALYRIDLEASSELPERVLKVLAARFEGLHRARIDVSVANPSRITRLYGTMNRKGKATQERPHRMSRLIDVPTTLDPVPTTLLEALASQGAGRGFGKPLAKVADRKAAYAGRALSSELSALSRAKPGERNIRLNKAAFNLGQLVGGGLLDRGFVEGELARTAEKIGLDAREIEGTIRSGLDAGELDPRYLEDQGGLSIVVIDLDEHRMNDEVIQALQGCENLFQRTGTLVELIRDPVATHGFWGTPNPPRIVQVGFHRLRELIGLCVRYVRLKETPSGVEHVFCTPPDSSVNAILARGRWPVGIRPLGAVIEAPTLRGDGTILDRPGYDPATALVYLPNAPFLPVPPSPSMEDARRAAERLFGLVADFPFAGDSHKAAWMAGLLTVLGRFAFTGPTPCFLFEAPTPASGKTLLADLISVIATGRPMSRTAYPESDDEMRKRITSIALSGDRMVLIDNIATPFGGSSLDSALTGPSWKDRVLGKSEMTQELPFSTVFFATGNNVQLRGDIHRRLIPCRLEPMEEHPEERSGFRFPNLLGHAARERGRYVVDGLTILRAYQLAGRPAAGLTPLGSYEGWCRHVRDAIHFATGIDPCGARAVLAASDPEAAERAALVRGWSELPGGQDGGLSTSEAVGIVRNSPDAYVTLREAFWARTRNREYPSPGSVGRRMSALRGRTVDGWRVESVSLRSNQQAWRVVRVN